MEFDYNPYGRVTREHHSDLNAERERLPSSMVDTHYRYVWPGRCSGLTLPDGQKIDYQFDQQLRLAEVTLNNQSITQIDRDELGREQARHQGQLTTYSDYDPAGRLIRQHSVHQQNKHPGPIQRAYDYDAFGNLSQLTDGPEQQRYVYDLLNRLKRVEGTFEETFDFDPAGNLLQQGQARGNRLTLQGDRKFTYDARGNLIEERRGKGGKLTTKYHYNLANQLVRVEKDGQSTHYRYDPLGRRIAKEDTFGTTQYLWAGDQMVQETRNHQKKTYIYEPESFRPLALVQDDEIYHYHLDHLGTPRELTNQGGKIVWKARYQTYGNVAIKEVDEIDNPIRFQGQYFDEETGLHYNRHRYYNPSTGQFTTQDPIGLLGGTNSYQYAPNPIQWVDPLGLKCKEIERVDAARERQHQLLKDNVGFNVSPTEWDAYPTIGRQGSFVSDKQGITDIIGDIDGKSKMTLEVEQAAKLEKSFGLEPGSLQSGFKVRKVENIASRSPRSPMEGNRFFLGAGKHLPGGAPEMVVDSIPTVDGNGVTTILEVEVK